MYKLKGLLHIYYIIYVGNVYPPFMHGIDLQGDMDTPPEVGWGTTGPRFPPPEDPGRHPIAPTPFPV